MTKKSKDEKVLINTIFSNVPLGSPGIEIKITSAIDIAKKHLSNIGRKYEVEDNVYLHSLRVAGKVSEFAKKISAQGFFRHDLIIIALLHDLVEDAESREIAMEELEIFKDYGTNSIIHGIIALTNDAEKIKEVGRSKYMSMKFTELSKSNDLFLIKLVDRIDNLSGLHLLNMENEEQKLFKDRLLLESLVIWNNLSMSGYTAAVPPTIYPTYSEFVSILNRNVF